MSHAPIPPTPNVIAPSPTPSATSASDGYFTSSIDSRDPDPDLARARSRNRPTNPSLSDQSTVAMKTESINARTAVIANGAQNGKATPDGLLSPNSAYGKEQGYGSSYWRNLSRSPSPLGLIPIHREWRDFIHKHEVPRKALHVSIGFVTLWLYFDGVQTSQIHPILLSLLIPIFTVDVIRFRWPAFNALYIKLLGPFMRESEAHDRFNGVISYLAGLWATMYFCRKDVAVMSVLLLSWADTAASTFGRWLGKYTPRIRKGKSLAGSLAAFVTGVIGAVLFYGYIAPLVPDSFNAEANEFAFKGRLALPTSLRNAVSLNETHADVADSLAILVLAFVSGIVASVSEAIDIFGLDDNLTIPILSGAGLGLFLWCFGDAAVGTS